MLPARPLLPGHKPTEPCERSKRHRTRGERCRVFGPKAQISLPYLTELFLALASSERHDENDYIDQQRELQCRHSPQKIAPGLHTGR